MNILVTGGAGYLGSHTAVELLDQGYNIIVVDNLVNSSKQSIERIEQITGKKVTFVQADVRNEKELDHIFTNHKIDTVIHFAGLKSVGASVEKPLYYYQNNIESTLTLCLVMQNHNVKNLVFSSSATVYGNPERLPIVETDQVGVGLTNPYGKTKYMAEQILTDLARSDGDWNITILRYFNPIGAHESGLIGEDPQGVPNNLLPYISQVAVGKLKTLKVFGGDYDTEDGSGVRDYIHVVDLAKGHVAALKKMESGANVYNLGTGKGTSVLELIAAFQSATNVEIPYEVVDRRPGDIAACYADAMKAYEQLKWKVTKSIKDACVDTWRWQSNNPDGF